ncbi:MAG: bacteriocin-protection protein, partial [Bacteroidota bacterium]
PGITCWIYFPKGSSGMQSDLSRDKGWDTLQVHSNTLDWLSLISFDEIWSAFACRLKTVAKTKPAKQAERPILSYIDAAT